MILSKHNPLCTMTHVKWPYVHETVHINSSMAMYPGREDKCGPCMLIQVAIYNRASFNLNKGQIGDGSFVFIERLSSSQR